ncbi:haloacid dehalogenase-like hydrolase [Candidatus Babeliales bacterium]|nr:haloacid dehalogenase-like hydrolase [Candidatus Babeliales bacterium]MCF7899278.1 haloacid dehalogenase-like hydrolase [Candidatus Babeliales bacterium]
MLIFNYKNKKLFAFFSLFFIFNIFAKNSKKEPEVLKSQACDQAKKQENKINLSLDKKNNISTSFKYAIFNVSGVIWEKRTYDLLSAYQKKKGASFSHYWKLVKFGTNYLFGDFDPKKAFESFLDCYKGSTLQELQTGCKELWRDECKNCLYKQGKEFFDKHKKEGTKTIIAEVGMKELYADLLESYKFDYAFFSELEIKDNKVSGKLIDEPCVGNVKFEKIKNLIEKDLKGSLKDAVFYASSHLDIPLLEEVGKPVVVNPTSKLESHAKKKKWEILKFKDFVKDLDCK